MIEPEMAFADLYDDMANAEAFVKAVVSHVLQHCKDDLAFFQKFYDKTLLDRLTTVGAAGHSLLALWRATHDLQLQADETAGLCVCACCCS